MKISNFGRKYSPGYRHMICIGKTKSTSAKGLLKWRKQGAVTYSKDGEKRVRTMFITNLLEIEWNWKANHEVKRSVLENTDR